MPRYRKLHPVLSMYPNYSIVQLYGSFHFSFKNFENKVNIISQFIPIVLFFLIGGGGEIVTNPSYITMFSNSLYF